MRLDGTTAPYVLDGPIDGETFRAYVEQMLAPTLAPGDIVVMDNLASHNVGDIRDARPSRRRRGPSLPAALQSLSQFDRELFAKIKAFLRRRAERNVEAL